MQDLHDSEAGVALESQVPCMQRIMLSLHAAVSETLWDPKTKCLLSTTTEVPLVVFACLCSSVSSMSRNGVGLHDQTPWAL